MSLFYITCKICKKKFLWSGGPASEFCPDCEDLPPDG